MNNSFEDPDRCEAIVGELPELALGTLTGRTRSEVLEHVDSCPRCRSELDELLLVADALQRLAPQMQPPLGFELRLAERLQGAGIVRRRRSRRVGALTAAAIVAVVLAFGLGTLVASNTGNGSGHPTADLATATLTSHGHAIGELVISAGNPAWMLVTVQESGWQGTVTCEVTLAGGRVDTIGEFELSGEYGSWAAPLRSPAGQVRSAQLISSNGTVLASARLGT
jgi:hypothetical protein